MPDAESSTIALQLVILVSICLVLLVLLLIMGIQISGRLKRLEQRLGQSPQNHGNSEVSSHAPSAAETSAGGAFETFLKEDPARRRLSKGEQFAAYRQWRQENGMNWSNS